MEEDLRTKQKGRILAVKDLPTLPGVLQEVAILVENPNTSTDQISKAISKDQVLSAKVLKMVNSPIYGFPGRIGSIQHALVLLGFNVIKGIIISTSVFDVMNANMKGLWEHSLGCALASSAIARAIGCKDPEEYAVAGLLHDIGKIGVPEHILSKKGPLTREEMQIMQGHVEGSIAMIKYLPSLDYVIPAAIGHHERWDGNGYPRGLAGEEIPVGARCLCVADAFDAMTTKRSYKQALSVEAALDELRRNLGVQFDPRIGLAFIKMVEEGKISLPRRDTASAPDT